MGPIRQESYNNVEGYGPERYSVGTNVVFTNDYGVSFPGRKIVRIEQDEKGDAYYCEPSDSPWFPARRENLTLEYIPLAKTNEGLTLATQFQFVADYFANRSKGIEYGDFGICWNEYVPLVADGGRMLEEVMQEFKARDEFVEEWYDVLELATEQYRLELIATKGSPDEAKVKQLYRQIVAEYIRG